MAERSELGTYLEEALSPLGCVVTKRMFGAAGLYCDGTFFAILDDGVLYLKVDEAERGQFEREGSKPFTYQAKGRTIAIASYYRAPERLLDDEQELVAWARRSVEAARRATTSRGRQTERRDRS